MTKIALIGAASGWGAGFRHTEDGPAALEAQGLAEQLRAAGLDAEWRAMITPEKRWRAHPEVGKPEALALVARHAAALADCVAGEIGAGRFPVVLGGDHSVLMGTWGGVARAYGGAPLGLIWLDAHIDAHTVATSPSMNAHGMGGAALLGYGLPPFLAICGGVLRPEHVCYIGIRSYEEGEMALLKRLGVRIMLMDEVERRGVDRVVEEAVAIVTRGTKGFGLSIDLDGFDPIDAPGIGLKEPHGLRAVPTLAALRRVAGDQRLLGLEIVEYIPEFDTDRRTARLVRDLCTAVLMPQKAAVELAAPGD